MHARYIARLLLNPLTVIDYTNVMRGTDDCWTDHHLVRSILSISSARKQRLQAKSLRRKYHAQSLQDPQQRIILTQSITNRLADLPIDSDTSVVDDWQSLKTAIHEACANSIGTVTPPIRTKIDLMTTMLRLSLC